MTPREPEAVVLFKCPSGKHSFTRDPCSEIVGRCVEYRALPAPAYEAIVARLKEAEKVARGEIVAFGDDFGDSPEKLVPFLQKRLARAVELLAESRPLVCIIPVGQAYADSGHAPDRLAARIDAFLKETP